MTILGAAIVNPSDTVSGERAAPRPAGASRRWLLAEPGRAWTLDASIALAVLLLGVLQLTGPTAPNDPFSTQAVPAWAVVVTLLCESMPLLARRRAPVAVLAVVLAACVAQVSLMFAMRSDLGLLVALYSVCRYQDGRKVVWAAAASLAAPILAVFRFPPLMQQRDIVLFFLGCAMVAAIALGVAAKSRHAQLQALADRANRLEVEREQRAQLATAAERSRVSREMHDIIGHNLAVITGLADGAARLASRQPADTAETTHALELIADTSRQALSELRRTLGVLGDPDADRPHLTPQPGLAEIPRLIERVRNAGPQVTYTTDGDLTHLAPGLQLTMYRIVQEALTNILKHAQTATRVTVAVMRHDHTATVNVHDDAPPHARMQPQSDGHGLLGLRERASLAGGTVAAGPSQDRGWSVSAILPIDNTAEMP